MPLDVFALRASYCLSLSKVIFLLGNDKINGCFAIANFVEIFPDSLTVSTNPVQSIQGEQTMTNIQSDIKVKWQNLGWLVVLGLTAL